METNELKDKIIEAINEGNRKGTDISFYVFRHIPTALYMNVAQGISELMQDGKVGLDADGYYLIQSVIHFPNRGTHADFVALIEKLNREDVSTCNWGFFEAGANDALSTYISVKHTTPSIHLNAGKYLYVYCNIEDATEYAQIAHDSTCLLCDEADGEDGYFIFRVK